VFAVKPFRGVNMHYLYTFVNSALDGEKFHHPTEVPPTKWPQNPYGCF
jgi:hypothetical protein